MNGLDEDLKRLLRGDLGGILIRGKEVILGVIIMIMIG